MFITNAGQASWIVCFASTDKSKGHRGLTAFVIPMDAEGVTIEKHLDKMGQRATDTSAVAFQDVVVPAANRLGEEGDGFKIAMQTLDFTRPGTAVGAVGVAQAAYELAVDYAKERVVDGELVRRLRDANHADRRAGAREVERLHRDLEAVALLAEADSPRARRRPGTPRGPRCRSHAGPSCRGASRS